MHKVTSTLYEASYKPSKDGRHKILVTYAGQEIPKSPVDVAVGPKIESSIIAHGPGLSGGVVGHPASFVVETNGETGSLGFSVAGPSQVIYLKSFYVVSINNRLIYFSLK